MEKNISTTEKNLIQLLHDLEKEKSVGIRSKLSSLSPFEIARLLEALEPRNREILWRMIGKEDEGEVLKELVEDVRQNLIDQMDTNQIIAATQDLELDDLADILNDLPDQITDEVIRALDRQDQIRLQSVMSYDEDSAGGLTNPNILSIRRGLNIKSLIRYLRSLEKLPENTNYIYVINRNNEYIGSVKLVDLFTQDTEIPIEKIMDIQVGAISASSSAEQVISTFQNLADSVLDFCRFERKSRNIVETFRRNQVFAPKNRAQLTSVHFGHHHVFKRTQEVSHIARQWPQVPNMYVRNLQTFSAQVVDRAINRTIR